MDADRRNQLFVQKMQQLANKYSLQMNEEDSCNEPFIHFFGDTEMK